MPFLEFLAQLFFFILKQQQQSYSFLNATRHLLLMHYSNTILWFGGIHFAWLIAAVGTMIHLSFIYLYAVVVIHEIFSTCSCIDPSSPKEPPAGSRACLPADVLRKSRMVQRNYWATRVSAAWMSECEQFPHMKKTNRTAALLFPIKLLCRTMKPDRVAPIHLDWSCWCLLWFSQSSLSAFIVTGQPWRLWKPVSGKREHCVYWSNETSPLYRLTAGIFGGKWAGRAVVGEEDLAAPIMSF